MIRPRYERTREHFRLHEAEIARGVRLLAEGWAIEMAETVASIVPGTWFDGVARRRVLSALADRIEDAVAWIKGLKS